MGSGDELDRETEDLLSMLGGESEAEPDKPAEEKPSGPQQSRGLTALLDDLDDPPPTPKPLPPPVDVAPLPEPQPQGKKRRASTEGETRPLRPPTAQGPAPAPPHETRPETPDPEPAPNAWPIETLSDVPAADVRPRRPKTDSELYPRVDGTASDDPSRTFEKPLDPEIKRPVSPVFEPGFTPPPFDPALLKIPDKGPKPPAPEPEPEPEPLASEPVDDPELAAAAADAALVEADPLAELRAAQTKKPRTLMWVGIIAFAAAGLGAVIYTQADAFHPERDKTRAMVAEDEKERAFAEHRRKQPVEGTLLIDASEPEAAVWLKLGRTPLESLAVSSAQVHEVRYELEGYKPVDAVVARPEWVGDSGEQRARQEVQLVPGSARAPAFPPQSAVRPAPGPQGKGPLVLTSTPAGAEVWLLIGFTPDVKFTGAEVGRTYEIKVLKDGYRPAFAAVTPDDWMRGDREVRVDVKLSALVADKRRRR